MAEVATEHRQTFSGAVDYPLCLRPVPLRITGTFTMDVGVRVDHGERIPTIVMKSEHLKINWSSIRSHFERCHPERISLITELQRREEHQ